VARAEAAKPCPFSLLNRAAVRSIRDTWRFQNLAPGVYEVSIEYKINRQ
jgi:hypothetical protein